MVFVFGAYEWALVITGQTNTITHLTPLATAVTDFDGDATGFWHEFTKELPCFMERSCPPVMLLTPARGTKVLRAAQTEQGCLLVFTLNTHGTLLGARHV